MSSTNKTSHYNLSQYSASDKPTYLVDYNTDMSNIDTGIYNAQNKADTNGTSIGTLSSLTTTEKTNLVGAINEVDGDLGTLSTTVGNHTTAIADNTSDIGNLTNLTTTDKTNLVGAVNEVNYNVSNFNLTSFETITSYTLYNGSDAVISGTVSGDIQVAKNSDGSLAKIYGTIDVSPISNARKVSFQTSLRPSTDITINGHILGLELYRTSAANPWNVNQINYASMTIKTDGKVEVAFTYYITNGATKRLMFTNSLLFIKDFGDTPIPEPEPEP